MFYNLNNLKNYLKKVVIIAKYTKPKPAMYPFKSVLFKGDGFL